MDHSKRHRARGTSFYSFISSRTVVRYDRKKEAKKRERWKKIVKESAEQSHRDDLPRIEITIV